MYSKLLLQCLISNYANKAQITHLIAKKHSIFTKTKPITSQTN